MADNCKYKIKGVEGEFTENELKAYLLKGGKAEYEKIKPPVNISDKNKGIIDKAVNSIVSGETTVKKVSDFLNKLPISEETKSRLTTYLNEQLKEKRKGTIAGLDEREKAFYDNYEDKFLNGEMSYENIMHLLGSVADRQPTQELRDKYNNIREIFYKENNKRAAKEAKKAEVKEFNNFNDEINNTRLGLSEEELRLYDQTARITGRGTVDFVTDTTLKDPNDQVVQTFKLNEFGNDLNTLLVKFQMKYGADNYLQEMQNFVADEKNQLDARTAVSTILNNHLENLIATSENPSEKVRLSSLLLKNVAASQPIARRVSLALNAFRAWNGLSNSEQAWVGIINPDIKNKADVIIDALGSEITDEDLAAAEDGTLNIFEDEGTPVVEEKATQKTAGFFKKRGIKNDAKNIKTKTKEELKEEIEKQDKKCK